MPRTGSDAVRKFDGINNTDSPSEIPNSLAQASINSDNSRGGMLLVRPGFSRSTLAQLSYTARFVIWWVARDGGDRLFYDNNGAGTLVGGDLPTEIWVREPVVRGRGLSGTGGSGPGAVSFPGVTDLTISALTGITLTWTNPTSEYWVGTKVLRRTDRYPQSPTDPDATVLSNNRLATVTDTDLEVGDRGYYSVYSYSNTRWGTVAKVNGVKAGLGVWDGTGTGTYWST